MASFEGSTSKMKQRIGTRSWRKIQPITIPIVLVLLLCVLYSRLAFRQDLASLMTFSSNGGYTSPHSFSSSISYKFDDPYRKRSILLTGKAFEIFAHSANFSSVAAPVFLGSPEAMIERLQQRLLWLDTMVNVANISGLDPADKGNTLERARLAYLETIRSFVSGLVYNDQELSLVGHVHRSSKKKLVSTPFNSSKRSAGRDWAYLGDTMTGLARLHNVRDLLRDVFMNDVTGDYIETGVWRGGSSMLARAVIRAYGQGSTRKSYVCDSFAGLPPGDLKLHSRDKGWDNSPYLEVPPEIVMDGFQKYSLLDENIIFAKGFFNETMKPLSGMIDRLSVIRLDGDMYESTVDVLYHLYGKLSIGGYVIVDDWFGFPARVACEDFFEVHGISPEIVEIDPVAVYWKKTKDVEIQYWRYEKKQFQP